MPFNFPFKKKSNKLNISNVSDLCVVFSCGIDRQSPGDADVDTEMDGFFERVEKRLLQDGRRITRVELQLPRQMRRTLLRRRLRQSVPTSRRQIWPLHLFATQRR